MNSWKLQKRSAKLSAHSEEPAHDQTESDPREGDRPSLPSRLVRAHVYVEKLIFVNKVRHAKVNGGEDERQWHDNAISKTDGEDDDSLRIDYAKVDGRRRIQLCIVLYKYKD